MIIAVVAPSGPPDMKQQLIGEKKLRDKFGPIQFIHAPQLRSKLGYLAGDDDARIEAMKWAFATKQATHIWFSRGGFGTTRIIGRLPWKKFAATGKKLLGYSDATSFLLAYSAAGGAAIHAPMIATDIAAGASSRSWISLGNLVFGAGPDHFTFRARWLTRDAGHINGSILPANIAVLASLAGTSHFPDGSRKVICLEEVKEEPYRIDRMLTQLKDAGLFHRARGIVFGSMKGCVPEHPSRSLSLGDVLRRFAAEISVPVVSGFPFGHGGVNSVLPVNGQMEIRGNRATVSIK